MNCQHCGEELASKRAKNCATCSGILNEANKRRVYGAVTEAIALAKTDGITGEDMHVIMHTAMISGQEATNKVRDEIRAREKERVAERSRQMALRNKFYAEHGYWPESMDEEDLDLQAQAIHQKSDGLGDIEEYVTR